MWKKSSKSWLDPKKYPLMELDPYRILDALWELKLL